MAPVRISQREVIEQRTQNDLIKFRPGITGLAQIHNIDMSTPKRMVRLDSRTIRFFIILLFPNHFFDGLSNRKVTIVGLMRYQFYDRRYEAHAYIYYC